MKKVFLIVLILGLIITVMWGCGGAGPGAPGSTGCSDYGLICEVTIAPEYLGQATSNVDAVQDTCTGGTLEKFTDHLAGITLSVRLMNPNATIIPPPIFFEKFTIEYRRNTDSVGTPPIETDTRSFTDSLTPLPLDAVAALAVVDIFVDIPRKLKYQQDMLSGIYSSAMGNPAIINNYTAVYTFEGQIKGTKITIIGTKSFSIGHYDNC